MKKLSVFTCCTPELELSELIPLLREQGYRGIEPRVSEVTAEERAGAPGFWKGNRATINLGDLAAELPGIVRGATQGKGLGSGSMKHMRRARVFLHVLDGTRDSLAADFSEVCEEICLFDRALSEVPQLVVVNKVDLPDVRGRVEAARTELAHAGVARHFVSALTGEGVNDLATGLYDLLAAQPAKPRREEEDRLAIIRPRPRKRLPRVSKEGDVFVVSSPQAERLVVLPDLRQFRARIQFRAELDRLGVIKALEAAGVRHDDTVRIGSREMQWE